ncbi:uncharacterized protein LOC127808560 [Diospyros lotus]|uniref:uncharacterized protein LOC127808560 n=1 Tax=Diospyros lotus TaxID=55363 RepID=UPI00224FAF96|nr:uncharacterized protein LOC127808560 [Diospyros lotus]
MEAESSHGMPAAPIFDGDNYQVWVIKMKVHLQAQDLWEAVEENYEVADLPANPTMNQIKIHKERKTRKAKAMAHLYAAVSPNIFTKIMNLSSAKAIWDHLKEEYQGNERAKNMQVLNLIREFEMQRMKESETVKEYTDMLLSLANKVRLLGKDFLDQRIIEKILVTLPERYEATISSLENAKDLSSISLAKLVNALQAQEQRRLMREGGVVEGALQAQVRPIGGKKVKDHNKKLTNAENNNSGNYPPCSYCKKTNHPQNRCWWRPDVKCNKCGQLGHITIVCRSQQQEREARAVTSQPEEEELF